MLPECCTSLLLNNLLIELRKTKNKIIAFLLGAITLAIYLFMKGLLTFSMVGSMIIKT